MEWEIILYIAALIAAIAFAVLVGFLAKMLNQVSKTLSNVGDTVKDLEGQLKGITSESAELLHKTNKLAEDVTEKTSRMNSVVDGIKGIGESLIDFNNSLKTASHQIAVVAEQNKEQTAQAMNWGTVGLELYKKYKRDKNTR